jgi:hypothetical protein
VVIDLPVLQRASSPLHLNEPSGTFSYRCSKEMDFSSIHPYHPFSVPHDHLACVLRLFFWLLFVSEIDHSGYPIMFNVDVERDMIMEGESRVRF